jgi:hypothetical protein
VASSAMVGQEGTIDVLARRGSYYLTCWVPQSCSGQIIYLRAPSAGSNQIASGAILEPLATTGPIACPTVACP